MDFINSELYIENEKLYDFAAGTAKLLRIEGESSGKPSAARLRRSFAVIRRSHETIARRYGELTSPPPACEWLLDNWYMVQRETRAAETELSAARRLRCTESALLLDELCLALLRAGQGKVDGERCALFLAGFQSVTALSRRELGLFPAALRAAVVSCLAEVCQSMQYAADTAAHARAFEALFGTLRLFSVLDLETLLSVADITNVILADDPTGDYARMESGTRQMYLERLEKLARRSGLEEQVYARRLIKRAQEEGRHVGFYLFEETRARGAGLYIGANLLGTLFFSLLLSFAVGSPAAAVLLLLPVSELVKSLLDFALLRILPPRRLPRMDLEQGVPAEGKTLCVLSALLTGTEGAESLARRLEECKLSHRNAGSNLAYGILADLPAADTAETERDVELLHAARSAINRLNRRYGGGFYLFTRPRSFDGERWTGNERKRGALIELAKLLDDRDSTLSVTGERDALVGTRYILTLDSDTRMYPGAALELIGAMLHPLCKPHIDETRGVVTSGFGLIHPRMATELVSATSTDFALIFAGAGGSDPYGALCGELYMNAFSNGGFAGKGILDLRALLTCTAERFPPQSVLSHDALEGAYLHGAFMGDVEFSDQFPSKPLSYYKRLHRWVRGDWQNAPWIFSRGRELTDIDRWRLFDNLRRSLLAPLTLLAILAGFFLPSAGLALAAWAALLALLSRLFLSFAEEGRRRHERIRLRRYTRLLTGVGGAIVQTFMRLWLLPYEAWVCLSAAVTALWRMLVSRKRLLEWETAAQSDSRKGGLSAYGKAMWPAMLLGLLCLPLSASIIGKAAGLLWLLSPLAAAALALPAHREETLSRADRDYLLRRAAETWRYYADFCTSEDHYLPPDNFQEQPPTGTAHRTSPTNIGLAAASAAAVCDMELIAPDDALAYLERLVSTLERMPRCLGHFYNWYDTRTLLPLHPAYVSTVDSGNLCAGLMVAAQFAREQGRNALAERIGALLEEMDFAPLYDAGRGLFYICYDASRSRGAGGWYDLMASEARLTSYLAIAWGDVPKKHWRRLSRGQLQKDGYRGLASWTGTMFEYLMPELFVPLCRGSLLYESSRFCLYAQKRRVPVGKPWGISESAFFSLDNQLNYRYKAHGCPALALKRGQENDLVVSPYSSFLALCVQPGDVVKNLRRLERFGALGRYGFIEALDFTPGRCRSDSGEPVRCYMAHHVGMSLLAAANVLCAGSVQRRFMAYPAMSAHSALLQERLPDEALVIRRDQSAVPERRERASAARWQRRGGSEDTGSCLLSNGAYNLLLNERGETKAMLGELLLYQGSPELWIDGQALLPSSCELWELNEDSAQYTQNREDLNCKVSVEVASGDCGEISTVSLYSEEARQVRLSLSLRPVLAREADYLSHPSFWQLGLWAEEENGALLLRRLRRGAMGEFWLCLACDKPLSLSADEKGGLGWLSRPFILVETALTLSSMEHSAVRFALCAAPNRADALAGAQRMLTAADTERGSMVSAAATLLGLSTAEIGAAMELLPALTENRLTEAAPRRALWRYGISGDLPLICCQGDAVETEKLLLRFLLLKTAGLNAELVYLTQEQGEYQRPFTRRISQLLARHDLEALLGSRGGVHFAPLDASETVCSRAAVVIGREPLKLPRPPKIALGGERVPGTVPPHRWSGRSFEFDAGASLPARPWQQLLTNGHLSYLATDCGSGNLWLENAREMPLNPPPGLPEAITGSETLWAEYGGKRISLFAANDGLPCHVSYSPGLAVWEKELGGRRVKTSAFIPSGIDARVLLIEGAEELPLVWELALCLGGDAGSVRCRNADGVLHAENPESYWPGTVFLAASSAPAALKCDFAPAAMVMHVSGEHITVLVCGCCGEAELKELCRPSIALAALSACVSRWNSLTDRVEISTGEAALDHYMNGWVTYQTLACRLMARGSLYQSGGAFGFRDQLQDAVNLMLLSPDFAKEQILLCCRHQYVEGDVMHWWHPHPEGDRGVRTRCSDDLLWLVWALCETYAATGDDAFCLREVPYISSPPLAEDERDRYETPAVSQASASVLDHARAALERCIGRGFGAHGLPLFGSGDWNDGMDGVDGESVWLGWFFAHCAGRFASLLDALQKPGAERYRDCAAAVGKAAEAAFNGRWYRRGYWADGETLGGDGRLDSTAQSWAALSLYSDNAHANAALDAALNRLVDLEHGLIRLFDPPYSNTERTPGYLVSYGEGFRENGGQYTHGAVWLALGCLEQGRKEEGYELLRLLLPESHDAARYGAEPYVLPADICAASGHEGESGWSWYTGSAGWYFRVVTEKLLGLKLRGGKLTVEAQLPNAIPGYRVRWTDSRGERHDIQVQGSEIRVDGRKYDETGVG